MEAAMGFDQKGQVVIRVQRNADGQWDVNEIGFEKPLATFENEPEALEYAQDLAKTKGGTVVQVDTGQQ
jgi:hypothetical protein